MDGRYGYGGYYGSPAHYYTRRQERMDDRMRQLLNMIVTMKQMREQRTQRTWQRQQQEENARRAQAYLELAQKREARLATPEAPEAPELKEWQAKLLYAKSVMSPPEFKKWYLGLPTPIKDQLELYEKKKQIDARYRRPEKPPTPTTFDKKKTVLDKRLKAGKITQPQYDEALYSIAAPPTAEETRQKGATKRASNRTWLKDVYKMTAKTKPRKLIKDSGGARPKSYGVFLDMPHNYNWALLNQKDGVATKEDLNIIEKYDAMFRVFQEQLLPRFSWKEFLKSGLAKDPDIDKAQIRKWYDYYK